MSHENLDLICPKCGHTDDFDITSTMTCRISEHGPRAPKEYVLLDRDKVRCPKCEHAATVKDFRQTHIRDLARDMYSLGADLVIDPDAEIDSVEEGYWVSARVFVTKQVPKVAPSLGEILRLPPLPCYPDTKL